MHLKPDAAPVRGSGLSNEIIAFLQSGVSIVMAVVGPSGRAIAGRALAVRVMPDSTIRLIYAQDGNTAVSASAASGGPIAVTFSAPLSHRTVQIKGFTSRPEELLPEDQACLRQQTDAFSAVLRAVSHPPGFVMAFSDYRSSTLAVLSFAAEEAFEQTPGPGAGRML
jgi:hypothetical protein